METEDAGAERLTFHRNQECCLMDGVKIITVRVWATAETHARATLDTGSRLNWMSKDVAKRIGAQIESLTDENNTYQLMDGNMMQPLGKVEATWHKDGKNSSGSLRACQICLKTRRGPSFPCHDFPYRSIWVD